MRRFPCSMYGKTHVKLHIIWKAIRNLLGDFRKECSCACVQSQDTILCLVICGTIRWPRNTNSSTLRLYSFTPRPLIPPLDSQIPPLDNQIPPLDYQIPPLDCQIPSLDDLRFLHSTTSDSFTRRPPNSSTLRLKSSTRRPAWKIAIMLPPNGRRLN